MDPELALILVTLAREFAGVPAQQLLDTFGATVQAVSRSDGSAVYDEASRRLYEIASQQVETWSPWEWTAEDDAAWRLSEDP